MFRSGSVAACGAPSDPQELTPFCNMNLRQIGMAVNGCVRILDMLVQGDNHAVCWRKPTRLDTSRHATWWRRPMSSLRAGCEPIHASAFLTNRPYGEEDAKGYVNEADRAIEVQVSALRHGPLLKIRSFILACFRIVKRPLREYGEKAEWQMPWQAV